MSFLGFSRHRIPFVNLLASPLYNVQIGPFQCAKSERAKLKVKVRLNLHGIVSIESATVSIARSFI